MGAEVERAAVRFLSNPEPTSSLSCRSWLECPQQNQVESGNPGMVKHACSTAP